MSDILGKGGIQKMLQHVDIDKIGGWIHLLKTISSEDVERLPPMDTIGSEASKGFETPDSEVMLHCKDGGGWPPQA